MNRLYRNMDQKGRSGRGMKRSSRKLLGLLIAGLLLGGFAAPAYAAEGNISFNGTADGNGNSDGLYLDEDGHLQFSNGNKISDKDTITGINVTLNHNGKKYPNGNTTVALIFNGLNDVNSYTVRGDVYVVNTVMSGRDTVEGTQADDNEGAVNNDAIYATGGATVNITGDKVYLASIAQDEQDITPVTAALEEWNFDAMKNPVNNSSVLAAKGGGGDNHITVLGKTVQLIGNLDFIGKNNGKNNTITAVLNGPDSFWYGDESNTPIEIGDDSPFVNFTSFTLYKGKLDVTLSDGAEWIYNANPSISALTLAGGIVNLQDEDIQNTYDNTHILDSKGQPILDAEGKPSYTLSDYRKVVKSEDKDVETDPHTYVDIGTLHGSGIFKADIDWEKAPENPLTVYGKSDVPDGSDYIFITNSETGTTQTLSFDESKAHLEKMGADDKLYFAYIDDGNTSFQTEHSVYSNAANVFNYKYRAFGEKNSDDGYDNSMNWYIGVTGKTAEDNANFTAARALMDAGYAMGTELDTLNKRMGEARYLDDDQGLWVRYRHGRSSRDNSYETDSNMIQLGYDRKNDAESGTHHRGVAFDYTDADTSLYQLSGSGDVERYALSLYDTWMGNKGHYYDFVIRGGRLNSGYDIDGLFSTGRESMDNSYHQWFGSVSFEYGRKKDMSGSWYIEPQAQLQLARIGGASFNSASGVRTDMDGMTSLIGRAGFRLGRDFGNDENGRDTFYVKADILHEFAGDRGFTLTGNDGWYTRNDNGTDTWYDVGIGADLSLGRNTYFWADVERILGSDFDNTWQVSGGLRWEW